MLLVDYGILASRPAETMKLIYQFIDEEPYDHDFENAESEAEDFDPRMLAKGLHTVKGKVLFKPRRSILPPDMFIKFQELMFWTEHEGTRAHRIVPRQEEGTSG